MNVFRTFSIVTSICFTITTQLSLGAAASAAIALPKPVVALKSLKALCFDKLWKTISSSKLDCLAEKAHLLPRRCPAEFIAELGYHLPTSCITIPCAKKDIKSLQYMPDGQRLLVVLEDSIEICDINSQQWAPFVQDSTNLMDSRGCTQSIKIFLISKDFSTVLLIYWSQLNDPRAEKTGATIVDLKAGKKLVTIPFTRITNSPAGCTCPAALAHDGSIVAIGQRKEPVPASNYEIHFYDRSGKKLDILCRTKEATNIQNMSFTPDSSKLVILQSDSYRHTTLVTVHDLTTNTQKEFRTNEISNGGSLSPDGTVFTFDTNKKNQWFLDTKTLECHGRTTPVSSRISYNFAGRPYESCLWSNNSNQVIYYFDDGVIRIIDNDGSIIRSIKTGQPLNPLSSTHRWLEGMCHNPAKNEFAIAGNGSIQIHAVYEPASPVETMCALALAKSTTKDIVSAVEDLLELSKSKALRSLKGDPEAQILLEWVEKDLDRCKTRIAGTVPQHDQDIAALSAQVARLQAKLDDKKQVRARIAAILAASPAHTAEEKKDSESES